MLYKLFTKLKLLCYSDKSLKLFHLLMLAVFPHKGHNVTDLRAMKAEPAAACLAD